MKQDSPRWPHANSSVHFAFWLMAPSPKSFDHRDQCRAWQCLSVGLPFPKSHRTVQTRQSHPPVGTIRVASALPCRAACGPMPLDAHFTSLIDVDCAMPLPRESAWLESHPCQVTLLLVGPRFHLWDRGSKLKAQHCLQKETVNPASSFRGPITKDYPIGQIRLNPKQQGQGSWNLGTLGI